MTLEMKLRIICAVIAGLMLVILILLRKKNESQGDDIPEYVVMAVFVVFAAMAITPGIVHSMLVLLGKARNNVFPAAEVLARLARA